MIIYMYMEARENLSLKFLEIYIARSVRRIGEDCLQFSSEGHVRGDKVQSERVQLVKSLTNDLKKKKLSAFFNLGGKKQSVVDEDCLQFSPEEYAKGDKVQSERVQLIKSLTNDLKKKNFLIQEKRNDQPSMKIVCNLVLRDMQEATKSRRVKVFN